MPILLQGGILSSVSDKLERQKMLALSLALVAGATAQGQASSPDYRTAYEFAHRCFVATSGFHDESGARRSYDAVMRLGRLQNFSNRQLNADFDRFTAAETGRLARDRAYRDRVLSECRTIGLAS